MGDFIRLGVIRQNHAVLGAFLISAYQLPSAQAIRMEGLVTDAQTAKAVPSASVKLVKQGLAATSDVTGKFLIMGSTAIANGMPFSWNGPIRISESGFSFSGFGDQAMHISLYNSVGDLEYRHTQPAFQGNSFLPTPNLRAGLHILRMSSSTQALSLPFSITESGKIEMSTHRRPPGTFAAMRKAAFFADTLEVSAVGYDTFKKGLDAPAMSNLEIKLTASAKIVVDEAFLKQRLSEFCGATPTLVDGNTVTIKGRSSAVNRGYARAVLKRFYKECGYTVSEHKYRENGINIVAEKKGLDDKIVILGAHFDGVRDYEAADDNGSGTMGVLGAACALADAPTPKHTIRFISFDEEEIGLVGSRAYAAKIIADNEKEKVIGVICADGMTYEPDHHKGGAVLSDAGGLGRAGNKVVSDALQWATANHPLNIKLEPFDDTRSGTDMGSFWEKGIPAVNTGTSMQVTVPFYHQPTDVVSRVQFDYMLRMTKMITHGIYKLAND